MTVDIDPIMKLIRMLEESSLTQLEYQDKDIKLALKKDSCAPVQVPSFTNNGNVIQEGAVDNGTVIVKSPIVGIVYQAKEPNSPPFVSVGQTVRQGDVLCLIEAMKMFSEIKAPCDGVVKEILFNDGGIAEFESTLMVIGKAV